MEKYIYRAKRFAADETAATMVEYALMLALISLACIGTIAPLGNEVKDAFEDVGEMLEELLED